MFHIYDDEIGDLSHLQSDECFIMFEELPKKKETNILNIIFDKQTIKDFQNLSLN